MNTQETFDAFRLYVGQALVAHRTLVGRTTEEMRALSGMDVAALEKSPGQITFSQFEVYCTILEVDPVRVLKTAQFRQEIDGWETADIRTRTIKEIEYILWKRRQKNGTP